MEEDRPARRGWVQAILGAFPGCESLTVRVLACTLCLILEFRPNGAFCLFPRTIKNLLSKRPTLDPLLVESLKPIKSPVQCLTGQLTLNPVEPRLLC